VAQEIEILLYHHGGRCPFSEWISSLKDARSVGIVRARLNRIRLGNFGDCKTVGESVEELRIDFGPGYRVYFARQGTLVVILLCGGSKKTQAKDIANAKKYWKEYLDAQSQSKN
jgi:putative addiction module killer protein